MAAEPIRTVTVAAFRAMVVVAFYRARCCALRSSALTVPFPTGCYGADEVWRAWRAGCDESPNHLRALSTSVSGIHWSFLTASLGQVSAFDVLRADGRRFVLLWSVDLRSARNVL